MSKSLFSILAIFLVSCTTPGLKHHTIDTVNLDSSNMSDKLDIKKGEDLSSEAKAPMTSKVIGISLILNSPLYSAISYIQVFKECEKREINISSISTYGFGAIIAALYAKKKSISYVEWKLFPLMNKLKNVNAYSSEWSLLINKFIDKEFSRDDFSIFPIKILIPFVKSRNVVTINDQMISIKLLKETIDISNERNYLFSPKPFSKYLRALGHSNIYELSITPKKLLLDKSNDFLLGVFSNYLGQLQQRKKHEVISLNTDYSIDSLHSTMTYLDSSRASITNIFELIKKDLADKEIR